MGSMGGWVDSSCSRWLACGCGTLFQNPRSIGVTMNLDGIKSIAGKLAGIGLPAIAGSVLGPGGALAVHSLLVALGLGADSTPEQAMAALGSLSGDQLVKMKELDSQVAQTQMQTAAAQVESVNKTLQT